MSSPESVHDAVLVSSASGPASGSFGVVSLANIVHPAPSSGSVSACISLPHPSLNADFAAAVQILIHAGAVNVPIPFAAMPVSKPQSPHPATPWTVGDGMTSALRTSASPPLINMILYTSWYRIFPIVLMNAGSSPTHSVQRLGSDSSTESLPPFEPPSIVLLVALVGAITVARRDTVIGQ
uniref:NAD(P)H-quinone oxidoreductase subunit 6, chloroplastic n=1 Tax=Selaginella doederleinii TaxID=186426 RepID=A0A482CI60_9TRAC|nr:NADH-plastoquinone oxidoreductase subunit 6 [Selaginella doederleinii]QBL76074.1 NADH-plastoquinone oxidoreductase subunit 6 [Selaginella doederleinii]